MHKNKQLWLDRAVQWIAEEDEPTLTDQAEVEDLLSVALVADVFNVHREYVARRVLRVWRPSEQRTPLEREGYVHFWCGRTVRQGVRHYPGGDPENGPAHRPTTDDSLEGRI